MKTIASTAALAAAGLLLLSGCTTPVTGSSRIGGESHRIFRGDFQGTNDHTVTGSVRVLGDEAGSRYVELGEDFKVVGAPDPKLGFGNNGKFDQSTIFTVVEEFEGQQTYVIPYRIDATAYTELYLWSDELGRVLGSASLRR
jgi:hypothetical protein